MHLVAILATTLLIYLFIFMARDKKLKKEIENDSLKVKRTEFSYRLKPLPKNIP